MNPGEFKRRSVDLGACCQESQKAEDCGCVLVSVRRCPLVAYSEDKCHDSLLQTRKLKFKGKLYICPSRKDLEFKLTA